MARIEQHPYLSPAAMELRKRDQTPTWGVHICELDEFADWNKDDGSAFFRSLTQARELRARLEAAGDAAPAAPPPAPERPPTGALITVLEAAIAAAAAQVEALPADPARGAAHTAWLHATGELVRLLPSDGGAGADAAPPG